MKNNKMHQQESEGPSLVFWLIATVAIVLFGWGVISANNFNASNSDISNSEQSTSNLAKIDSNEWVKGNLQATVELVEYSDFQCPACKNFQPIVDSLITEFGNDIKFSFRHFPLRQIHGNAQLAAQGAEAAGLQNKFWEMSEKLFSEQAVWSKMPTSQFEEALISYANDLSLDLEKFEEDLNSSNARDAVNADYQSGVTAGVNSTPTLYLNGKKLNDGKSVDQMREAIRDALASTATPATTTSR